jgi:KaiC/GvpD/RAD55 family RecA-like ATPase
MAKPREPHRWLVKGWVTEGEVAIVAGPSGSGKTFAVWDLAASVARGLPFLGKYKSRQGLVIYQAGEGAKGLLSKRVPAYRQANGLRWEDELPVAFCGRPIDLARNDEDAEALIADTKAAEAATGTRAALIVIDTVSAATPGCDENASKEMGPVLARCYRIARETGAAVVLVAHLNAAGEKVRGWSGITANVDSVINCAQVPDHRDARGRQIRQLQITKAKDGEATTTEKFVLVSHEIGRDEDGDPITSCTIAAPDAGGAADLPPPAPPAERERLTDRQFTYLRALRAAIRDHGEPASAKLNLPIGSVVVHKDRVAEAFAALWQGEEPDDKTRQSRLRKARQECGERFLALGIMGSASPYLWLTGKPLPGAKNLTQADQSSRAPQRPQHPDPDGDLAPWERR